MSKRFIVVATLSVVCLGRWAVAAGPDRIPAGPYDPPRTMIITGVIHNEEMDLNQFLTRLSGELVFYGRVVSIDRECYTIDRDGIDMIGNTTRLTVEILEELAGHQGSSIVDLIVANVSDPDCVLWLGQDGPEFIEVGDEYIFPCIRDPERGELFTHCSKLFCLDSGKITRCNPGETFTFSDAKRTAEAHFESIRVDAQFRRADLVLEVFPGVSAKLGGSENLLRVSRVYKGEWSRDEIAVHVEGGHRSGLTALRTFGDKRLIVFLKSVPGGGSLLHSARSCFLADSESKVVDSMGKAVSIRAHIDRMKEDTR